MLSKLFRHVCNLQSKIYKVPPLLHVLQLFVWSDELNARIDSSMPSSLSTPSHVKFGRGCFRYLVWFSPLLLWFSDFGYRSKWDCDFFRFCLFVIWGFTIVFNVLKSTTPLAAPSHCCPCQARQWYLTFWIILYRNSGNKPFINTGSLYQRKWN